MKNPLRRNRNFANRNLIGATAQKKTKYKITIKRNITNEYFKRRTPNSRIWRQSDL